MIKKNIPVKALPRRKPVRGDLSRRAPVRRDLTGSVVQAALQLVIQHRILAGKRRILVSKPASKHRPPPTPEIRTP